MATQVLISHFSLRRQPCSIYQSSLTNFPIRHKLGFRSKRKNYHAVANAQFECLEARTVFAGVVADYAVTENWGSGFIGEIQLSNQQTADVTNWRLEFDYGASISSIWNAQIVSHVGNHYVISNAGWNSTLAASSKTSFGFVASPGASANTPTNYRLNGSPLGNATPPPPVLPTLSVADVSMDEGNSGSKNAAFTFSLSAAATDAIVVSYATADGTAKAGSDYLAKSGKLTFAVGEKTKTVNVQILGDTLVEDDETFNLVLSGVVGAKLARSSSVATIRNDDVAPPPPSSSGRFSVYRLQRLGRRTNGRRHCEEQHRLCAKWMDIGI